MSANLNPSVEELLEDFDRTTPTPLNRRERLVEGAAGAAFLAAAIAMTWLPAAGESFSLGTAALLIVAYAAAATVRFPIGFGYTVPTQLVFVPMLLLLPPGVVPLAVAAAAALAGLPDIVSGRRHPDRALLYLGDSWHAVGPALVFAFAHDAGAGWSDWPVYAAALGAQFAFDTATSTLREWLALGISPRLQPRLLGWVFLVDLLLTPAGLLAAFGAEEAPLSVLATLPLVALLGIFARERRQRLTGALELSRAYRGTTQLLSDVLEADDEYTGVHSRDVVSLALATSDELGLGPEQRRNVEFGALLHDLGKISIPTELINKPGPLSADEWVVVKTHTVEGQRMLDRVGGVLSDVGRIVRSSHERWDGNGYPDGLAGDEIPLESAIVACCDAFNAMTTDRSYRRARPPEQALEEVLRNAGTQFHPRVAAVLARIVERDMRSGEERPARSSSAADLIAAASR